MARQVEKARGAFRVPAAAEYMDVSTSTIWRLIKRKELPSRKLLNTRIIAKADCDALLARTL